jgi:murein endopeptidase
LIAFARHTGPVRRLVLALLILLVPAPAVHAMPADGPPDALTAPAVDPLIAWRESRALGKPYAGRLLDGVQLPAEGRDFWTYDWGTRASPNRSWRRWGTDRLVRTVLDVIGEYRAANPDAPRVGIADLSRTRGGPFGENFGGLGHASHQNGLDVDILYPRADRLELHPESPAVVDRALAQDLVDRFVGAGAVYVFTGPRLGLRGPRKVVVRLRHHDDHLHVRIR